MRFDFFASEALDEDDFPTLAIPIEGATRGPQLLTLKRGASLQAAVAAHSIDGFTLALQWPKTAAGEAARVELNVRDLTDQNLRFAIVGLSPTEFEIFAFGPGTRTKRCVVRCANGQVGAPCALCTVNGRTVRFCC